MRQKLHEISVPVLKLNMNRIFNGYMHSGSPCTTINIEEFFPNISVLHPVNGNKVMSVVDES